MNMNTDPIIEIKDMKTKLGGEWVHKNINLTVNRGEVLAIVGGSGSGKTTLLREMLALTKPTSGSIKVFGQEITQASPKTLLAIQKRWGTLFQQSALFSSLTLEENVAFPLKEHTNLDQQTIADLAFLKIMLAGLPQEAGLKFPAELSGGMQKRAGLARALVLDPEIVFLDEPTSGLDPVTAAGFDQLIADLQSSMGLTIVMVTHDIDSLWRIANRVAFLGEGVVLDVDTMPKLMKNPNPMIQAFFNGPRGRAAAESQQGTNHGN
ncbi:MAG: ATP-binding cassette domain-containing protein [Gammaproteobacteria bacterium]|nr:ATP-binding cassette domain-containing protein [Gammaproteobacteria bacterium]